MALQDSKTRCVLKRSTDIISMIVPDCNIGVPPVRKYASYHTLRGFSPGTCSGFLPQGKLTGWVFIKYLNYVCKIKSANKFTPKIALILITLSRLQQI